MSERYPNNQLLNLETHLTNKGALTVIENTLPFDVKRIFWIYNTKAIKRGMHRHRKTIQVLVPVSGEVSVSMNNNHLSGTILLKSPRKGLIVYPEDFHSMTMNDNAVLLVFCSELFNKDDYIYESY